MRVEVEGQLRGGWGGMCLESLVGFCMERMCMDFKIKMEGMERAWRRFEMVSKRGKGVWRG